MDYVDPPWYVEHCLDQRTPWKFFLRDAMGTPWRKSFWAFAVIVPNILGANLIWAFCLRVLGLSYIAALVIAVLGQLAIAAWYARALAYFSVEYEDWWDAYDRAARQYQDMCASEGAQTDQDTQDTSHDPAQDVPTALGLDRHANS